VTDELVHDAQSAVDRDDARLRGELTADETQSVVLPAPLGPMSAVVLPSATRNVTSSSRGRPSGSTKETAAMSM
jgi:hypothetical protein